jgi:hypothetical protein
MPIDDDIQQSLEKLNLQHTDWARELTAEDILYLLDHCPFLQIVSTGESTLLPEPEFITAKSGWVIHHYGDAMSSSPGELLFAGGDFRLLLDDGDSDGGMINPGKGTLIKQAFDTAADMIRLAQTLKWRGVQIVDGHPLMQWAAWMQAEDDAYPITGFEPTEKDRQKRERVKRSDVEDQVLLKQSTLRR